MIVKIKKTGTLVINKLGEDVEQICPFSGGRRHCGIYCPHFNLDGNVLNLCMGTKIKMNGELK